MLFKVKMLCLRKYQNQYNQLRKLDVTLFESYFSGSQYLLAYHLVLKHASP